MSQENISKKAPEYKNIRSFWASKSAEVGGTGQEKTSTKKNSSSSSTNSIQQDLKSSQNTMAGVAPSFVEFEQEIMNDHVSKFVATAQQLGGEIAEHGQLVQKAFNAQKKFLGIATQCAKPNDSSFQQLLGETASAITEIQAFREKRRSSKFFNHLSGVSESIPALAWVTISPTPGPHIKEMNDAGQFYTNRVLKEFKDQPGHAEWVKLWVGTLTALQTYVRKNHTTGLVWGKAPFVGGGGPPCAPPPPPPPAFDLGDMQNLAVSDDRAALFASLNKGEGITAGLKHVSADMQTHKNPNLRAGSTVAAGVGGSGATQVQKPTTPSVKPPKLLLEGKKWVVEHQIGQKSLLIDKTEMNQVVYVFGCKDSILTVKGKLNSIVIDSCVKTALVFDSLVSSVEFVNSRDCQMQVMGKVPTITIDKMDGLQVFLSSESLGVEIFSSKSSALNVMIPQPNNEFAECPIPEQLKTVVGPGGKGLVTVPSETVGV